MGSSTHTNQPSGTSLKDIPASERRYPVNEVVQFPLELSGDCYNKAAEVAQYTNARVTDVINLGIEAMHRSMLHERQRGYRIGWIKPKRFYNTDLCIEEKSLRELVRTVAQNMHAIRDLAKQRGK